MRVGIQPSTVVHTVIPRCACKQEVAEHPRQVNMTSHEQLPLREATVLDELRLRELVDAEKRDTIWIGSSTITMKDA